MKSPGTELEAAEASNVSPCQFLFCEHPEQDKKGLRKGLFKQAFYAIFLTIIIST